MKHQVCTPCVEAYLDSDEMRASYVGPRKEEEERMKIQKEQRTLLQQHNRASAQKDHESVDDYKLRHTAEREKILRQLEEQSHRHTHCHTPNKISKQARR